VGAFHVLAIRDERAMRLSSRTVGEALQLPFIEERAATCFSYIAGRSRYGKTELARDDG
jgi:hypothetical protein